MTHSYELHTTSSVECLCCRSIQPIYFWSDHQPVICKSCERHQGHSIEKIKQRDKDHVGLWGSTLALLAEDHRVQVQQLRRQLYAKDQLLAEQKVLIDDLRAEVLGKLSKSPEGTVQAWFDRLRIEAAHKEVEASYRSRAHVLRALWAVAEVHHAKDATGAVCSCGKKSDQCPVYKGVYAATGVLEKWEQKQLDRLHDDLPHELPFDHPEVLARNPWPRRYRA